MLIKFFKFSIPTVCTVGIIYISIYIFNKNKNKIDYSDKSDKLDKSDKSVQTNDITVQTKDAQCNFDIDNLLENNIITESYNKYNYRWLFLK